MPIHFEEVSAEIAPPQGSGAERGTAERAPSPTAAPSAAEMNELLEQTLRLREQRQARLQAD